MNIPSDPPGASIVSIYPHLHVQYAGLSSAPTPIGIAPDGMDLVTDEGLQACPPDLVTLDTLDDFVYDG